MATNLATILVGLGYDLSALEKGAPEAFRLINQQTLGMSAEMKRTSREGAEAWRLIDEALGVHVSRPLTRIVTQQFPEFAKAMSGLLGAGVVGGLGVAAFEGIEHGMKKIEEAEKKEHEWQAATAETRKLMSEGTEHYAESLELVKAKLEALTGNPGPLQTIEHMRELGRNTDEARKLVDQLAESMMKEGKAAEEASSYGTRFWLGLKQTVEDAGKGLGATDPVWKWILPDFDKNAQTQGIKRQFEGIRQEIDEAFHNDRLHGTHDALRTIENDLAQVNVLLTQVKGNDAAESQAQQILRFLTQAKEWAQALEKLNQALKDLQAKLDAAAANAAALERQKEAQRDLEQLYKSMGESLAKLQPETDPIKKLDDEIRLMAQKAGSEFRELQRTTDDALMLKAAQSALDSYLAKLQRLKESLVDLPRAQAAAEAALQASAKASGLQLPQTLQPQIVMPRLQLPQTSDQAQLATIQAAANEKTRTQENWNVALQKAGEILNSIETPAQKFQTAVKELNALEAAGVLTHDQVTAAIAREREELTKAEDQVDRLLKSGGASGGLQAFLMQWMGQTGKGSDGQFVFDLLNKGLQGFEDETVKVLTGGKTEWKKYFAELDQMALKFLLNKELASLFKMFAGSGIGQSLGLDKLLGGGIQNAAETANTTAVTANTTALTANSTAIGVSQTSNTAALTLNTAALATNTAALAALTSALSANAATSGVGDIGGGGGFSEDDGGAVPFFASGTDYAPGGLAWVGEQGPELVNLPAGSSVTPNSQIRGGGISPTVHVNIDARGAQMGVGEQIARALNTYGPQMVMRAVIEAFETQKRTVGGRL